MVSLCQIAAVSARVRCGARARTPWGLRPSVAFQIELCFQGPIDRFDDLAE
jgi:hypothetical protein